MTPRGPKLVSRWLWQLWLRMWPAVLLCVLLPPLQAAPAQDKQELEDYVQFQANELVGQRVMRLLLNHFDAKEFRALTKTTITMPSEQNGDEPQVPYWPWSSQKLSVNQPLSPHLLKKLVTRVEITVFLASRFTQVHRQAIENLLRLELLRDGGEKLAITFESLDMPKEESETADERQLARQVQTLTLENGTLKRERSDISAKIQDMEAQLKAKGEEIASLKDDVTLPTLLKRHIGVAGGMAAWIFGILLLFMVILLYGRSLGGAIKTVATSLSNLGGALADGRRSGGGGGANDAKQAAGASASEDQDKVIEKTANVENMQRRMAALQADLARLMTATNDDAIIELLAEDLMIPARVPYAVVLLELLGAEKANNLYNKLSQRSQLEVLQFLREKTYPLRKDDMMLEAGERLKTKLFAANYDRIAGQLNKDVKEAVYKLSDEDLAGAMAVLDRQYLPRLFLHLSPKRIAAIIKLVAARSPSDFNAVTEMLHLLPEAENSVEFDGLIVKELQGLIATVENSRDRLYIPIYEKIINSLGEDFEDSVIEKIARHNQVIGQYLRQNVISFNTFYKITTQLQETLIDELSNRQIAAILHTADPANRQTVEGYISQRRREMIDDELRTLATLDAKALDGEVREARRAVVERLRQLKQAEQLDFQPANTSKIESRHVAA